MRYSMGGILAPAGQSGQPVQFRPNSSRVTLASSR